MNNNFTQVYTLIPKLSFCMGYSEHFAIEMPIPGKLCIKVASKI